jgi:hypothetical protein
VRPLVDEKSERTAKTSVGIKREDVAEPSTSGNSSLVTRKSSHL